MSGFSDFVMLVVCVVYIGYQLRRLGVLRDLTAGICDDNVGVENEIM